MYINFLTIPRKFYKNDQEFSDHLAKFSDHSATKIDHIQKKLINEKDLPQYREGPRGAAVCSWFPICHGTTARAGRLFGGEVWGSKNMS